LSLYQVTSKQIRNKYTKISLNMQLVWLKSSLGSFYHKLF